MVPFLKTVQNGKQKRLDLWLAGIVAGNKGGWKRAQCFIFVVVLLLKIEFWQWLPNSVALLKFTGLLHVWIFTNYISI